MPYLVRENLFLGNIGDAAKVIRNGSKEITHILCAIPTKESKKVYDGGSLRGSTSVGDGSKSCLLSDKLSYSLERAGKDLKLVRMGVPLRDMDDENLLDYLDVSQKKGSVLVHCFAGVSRSASIITAYPMRTEHLSQEDAPGSLRQSCEFVCPNDGFLDQLKMYEEMGFKVDHASPIYKSFRLKVLGESYHRGDKIDSSKFGADPGLPSEVASGLKTAQIGGKTGESEKSFEWRKRKSSYLCEDSECSSIFVEPLRWMTAVEEEEQWRASCHVHIVKLAWVTSIGQLVRHPMQLWELDHPRLPASEKPCGRQHVYL
ncbi:hypothetical protein PRUPE_4G082800 [Prunus persica]|uniref:protein-tyrosine-phosphatase n=1 Tax=Prunus persica TaxID=3760 RepID=A0A251PHI2_PRUPE|nr:hypothetical protein PRUPE_4G082800 [Prunus persica]